MNCQQCPLNLSPESDITTSQLVHLSSLTRPTLTLMANTPESVSDSVEVSSRPRFSRSPSSLSRPTMSPLGPRSRFSSRATTPFSDTSSNDSVLGSPVIESAPAYPGLPASASPVHTPKSLAPIIESAPDQVPSPHLTTAYIPPAPKMDPKPAVLIPPPQISFDSVSVDFKSLPLEAFLWTLDNVELQQMVSRAIQQSARESSIRLLSLDNVDHFLPAEIQRLNSLKLTTQSRYRFLVQRRTMLLQALNSSSSEYELKPEEDVQSITSLLARQLSETCAECDKLLEELVCITDQLGQITKLLDTHWASALAIALRKINKSYTKRVAELVSTQERVEQLEAELEEAWKEAARYAQEMDDVEAAAGNTDDGEEAVIERVEKVAIQRASTLPDLLLKPPQSPSQPLFLPEISPFSPLSPIPTISPIRRQTSQILPANVSPSPSPPLQIDSETASLKSTRSMKSTRSARSVRSTRTSRMNLVAAARKRSLRVSKDSLRMPSRPKLPILPPVPDLPLEISLSHLFPPLSSRSSPPSDSGTAWPNAELVSPVSASPEPSARSRFRRMSSVDFRSITSPKSWRTFLSTKDDISLRPQQVGRKTTSSRHTGKRELPPLPPSLESAGPVLSQPMAWDSNEVADYAPRTPLSLNIPFRLDMAGSKRAFKANRPSTSSGMQLNSIPSSRTSYSRWKSLSKRYSMTLPLFKSVSTSTLSVRSLAHKKKQVFTDKIQVNYE